MPPYALPVPLLYPGDRRELSRENINKTLAWNQFCHGSPFSKPPPRGGGGGSNDPRPAPQTFFPPPPVAPQPQPPSLSPLGHDAPFMPTRSSASAEAPPAEKIHFLAAQAQSNVEGGVP